MNIIIENILMNTAKRFGKQTIEDNVLHISYSSNTSNHQLTPVTVSNASIDVHGTLKPFKVSRKPITIVKDNNGEAYIIHNVGKKVQWYKVTNSAYFLFDYEACVKDTNGEIESLTGMLSKQVNLEELLGTFPEFFAGLKDIDQYSKVTIGELIGIAAQVQNDDSRISDYLNGSASFSRALVVLLRDEGMISLGWRDNIHTEFKDAYLTQLLPDAWVDADTSTDEENTITPTASAWMDVEDVDLVANELVNDFTDEQLSGILDDIQNGDAPQAMRGYTNLNMVMANPELSGSITPSLWAEAVKAYRRYGESSTPLEIVSATESTLERDFENDLYNLLGRYAVKGLNVPVVLGRILGVEDKDER